MSHTAVQHFEDYLKHREMALELMAIAPEHSDHVMLLKLADLHLKLADLSLQLSK